MRFNQILGLAVCGSVALTAAARAAGFDGTAVTGSLRFVGNVNYFDPANNRVPGGYGNSTSATNVTIADPGIEFGFQDQYGRITADFAGTRLTISETALIGTDAVIERYAFTNNAFANLVTVPISNTYPVSATTSLSGSTLQISLPDGYSSTTGNTTTLSLAITLPGDADLNGTVNFNDFLALQASFGNAGTSFQLGNFNGDANTDFNDFLALQSNFGQSVGGTAATAATAEEFAALSAFATAHAVPEPASVTLFVTATGGVILRRARRE
ncbi:MAG: PEP-CTERM sorting domain-containing protein [Tepidisphaeraceae bacterium]